MNFIKHNMWYIVILWYVIDNWDLWEIHQMIKISEHWSDISQRRVALGPLHKKSFDAEHFISLLHIPLPILCSVSRAIIQYWHCSLVQIRERKRSNACTLLACLTASRQRFMSPRIRGKWRSERSILLSTSVLMEPIIGLTAGEYLIRLDGGWRECKLRYPPVIHISATRCSHWKLQTHSPKCLTSLVELAQ